MIGDWLTICSTPSVYIHNIWFRHSTAWTEKDENEFLEFGDSMYSDASDTSQTKNAAASWAPVSNIGFNDQNRPKRKRPKTIRLNWKRRRQDRQDKKRVLAAKMNIKVSSTTNKPPSNNGSAKPLNRHRLKSRYEAEALCLIMMIFQKWTSSEENGTACDSSSCRSEQIRRI